LDDSIIRELAWESYPENNTRDGYNPQDDPQETTVNVIDPEVDLMTRIVNANHQNANTEEAHTKLGKPGGDWQLNNERLLFKGRLYVPDENDLRSRLLDKIHRQPSTAHPGRTKTRSLVRKRYYWESWSKDVNCYLDNCMVCKWTNIWRDLPPRLLNPLPIPD
jgi:hypothetical protein